MPTIAKGFYVNTPEDLERLQPTTTINPNK